MDSGHPARSGSESTVHGAPTSQPPQLGGDDPKSANEADNEDVQDAAGTVPAGSSLGLSEATTPTPTASAFKANSAQTQAQAQAQPQAQPQASAIHARETTPNRAGTARTQSVQSSGSAHNHATNQAALGRGRAPTLTSHTSTLSTTGSPRSRSSVVLPTMASRPAGQGQGHRSMPSTSASLTFSDAPTSANFGGAGTQTETESVLSGDEGDTGTYGSFAGQPGVRRSKIPLHPSQSQTSNARVGRSGPGGLKPSAVGTAGKGKARLRSTSRAPQSDSSSPEDDDIERRKSVGEDSINVLPVGMKPAAANLPKNDMDDDEVQRRDRGEELVRRRMRERKKEKKEAEKRERKRKDEEIRRERERQNARTQKGTGAAPPLTGRESMLSDMPLLPGSAYEERPSLSRRSTDPTILDKASQSSFSRAGVTSRESSATTGMPIGAYSPTSGQQSSYWPPPPTNSSLLSATPTPQSPFFPPGATQRATSYARSNVSVGRSDARRDSEAADVFSEAEHDEVLDQVPELTTHQGSAAWRDDVARSMREETSNHDEAAGDETEQLGTVEDEEEEDDEDDDDLNEDVEYTLKDRQDAINIEHPFGLPIWKPALYKKDRSVTRNADKDLHQAPSSATERHLIPGNILWAALFGWWMALFGIICAAVLCIVPFGGAKYGRVIWELAGYLFWPFGKYVEKYEESSADDSMKGYDELSEDGDETVYDDPERPRDVEEAGRTWGRRSGNSSASVGTVKKAPSRPDLIDALEDRRPSSAAPAISREAGLATPTALQYKRSVSYAAGTLNEGERTRLLPTRSRSSGQLYGATGEDGKPVQHNSSGSETEVAEGSPAFQKANSFDERSRQFRVRAAGRLAYWTVFYLFVAPMMLFVCILCWGLVFTIPMAKLLWILLCNLGQEPLGLHFRSPSPHYNGNNNESGEGPNGSGMPQLEAGQKAPRHSRKTYDRSRAMGRLVGPDSTILLCTKKALGLKYYKYTIDGTNIIFINLLPLIAFVIFDFFVIAPLVEKHHVGGFLAFISSQATMFVLSLLSVIPLSYFIGMAVASISAQSSIGMGAVINATFGSIIEIILYSIALTQSKGSLVEGSIVGSLLAGVLLMPGLSMIGGAVRRKEQRFNARSAGVTSTMLIMAIIGILTPTLFYEIYGTFQLTCSSCPEDNTPDNFTCRRCFYEHVDPVDDEFYQSHVKALGYYCAILLVFSYLLGLWFSLRTHASQIWQNAQHAAPVPAHTAPHTAVASHFGTGSSALPSARGESTQRGSMYKRLPLPLGQRQSYAGHAGDASFASNNPKSAHLQAGNTPLATPDHRAVPTSGPVQGNEAAASQQGAMTMPMQLPAGMTAEEVNRAFQVVAATASVFQSQQNLAGLHPQGSTLGGLHPHHAAAGSMSTPQNTLRRQASHVHEREVSRGGGQLEAADEGGHGGHDAPNWSRSKSYSVLFGCTLLYAIISEILVDVVDVVLEGSGIPEKFLGITLFALVPNVTEFMNAISFAMNGNIALSMEIGSAYAIQVCMIQIPAMIAFTFFYGLGKDSMLHRAFSLVFPRWDAISIMFSVFLLTYTYIEARSNYYRGSILVLSYMVLLGGFFSAPAGMDTSDDPLFTTNTLSAASLSIFEHLSALYFSLFSR